MAAGWAPILGVNPYNTPPSGKSRSRSFKPGKGYFCNIGYVLYELLVLVSFYLGGHTRLLSMLPSCPRLMSLLGPIRAPKLVYCVIPTLLGSVGYFYVPGLSFRRGLLRFRTLPSRRRVLGYSKRRPAFGTWIDPWRQVWVVYYRRRYGFLVTYLGGNYMIRPPR